MAKKKHPQIIELEKAWGIEIKLHEYAENNKEIIQLVLNNKGINTLEPLKNLTNLIHLDLSKNKINCINGLEKLTKLRELNLYKNSIHEINGLDNLTNLNYLHLGSNKIKKISGLDNLQKLMNLKLYNNQIFKIDGLEKLYSLKQLNLTSNQISILEGLENLNQLTNLHLADNQIIKIDGLSNQINLIEINLSNNQIAKIEGFEQLKNLETLYLSLNQIIKLEGIDQLINLIVLDISFNNINEISEEFAKRFILYYDEFFHQMGVFLIGNPLDEQLIIAIKQGQDAVLAYYENLNKGSVILREAKLMILGEGNAGKTNLRNLLLSEAFNLNESTTLGIKIDQWELFKEDKMYRINIWDVGGQWIQQQVHKFFITDHCLYVILINARNEEQPNKWLDWVKTYAPNSKVVVVANKYEEPVTFKLRESSLKEQYPFILDFHYVSLYKGATDTDFLKPVQELQQSIEKQLISLDSIEENVPKNYIDLKDKIETALFPIRPYISYETFEAYFKEFNISGDYHNLLEVYQRIGTIRYFKDTFRYILNPEWLSAGVYKILTCERSRQLKGILSEKEFEIALEKTNKEDYEYRKEKGDFKYLREMMREFNLAYFDASNTCYIPQLFDIDKPRYFQEKEADLLKKEHIHFYFQYEGYFPDSIICQLIAKQFEKLYQNYYYQEGIILHRNEINDNPSYDTFGIVVSDINKKRIDIKVIGVDKQTFFKEIRDTILNLHGEIKYVYKEFVIDNDSKIELDYKKLLSFYYNGKKTIDESDENYQPKTIQVSKVLGYIQEEREIKENAYQTIVVQGNLVQNYHARQINQLFWASEFNNYLDQLDAEKSNLNLEFQEKLDEILLLLNKLQNIAEPKEAKSFSDKITDKISNFIKNTIPDQMEKEGAKGIIYSVLGQVQAYIAKIPWQDYLSKLGIDYDITNIM